MQYKTIVLELLKERKELHEQLRLTRRLLPTMESLARELKTSHEPWKETLARRSRKATRARSRPKQWKWLWRNWRIVYPPCILNRRGSRFRSTRRWLSSEVIRRESKTRSRPRQPLRRPAQAPRKRPLPPPPPPAPKPNPSNRPRSRPATLRLAPAPARSPAARKPRPATSSPPSAR